MNILSYLWSGSNLAVLFIVSSLSAANEALKGAQQPHETLLLSVSMLASYPDHIQSGHEAVHYPLADSSANHEQR